MKNDISIWLIPEEKQRKQLQNIIDYLAHKYKAYSFIPHITIYYLGELFQIDKATQIIKDEIQNIKPITIDIANISFSDIFIKTLYIQFKINNELKTLHKKLKTRFFPIADYILNPHLSLIYKKNMNKLDKEKDIKKIILPKSITFNRIMLITNKGFISREKDVLGWKIEYEKKF